ncbi:hypothetical protein Nos7524_2026 [Nostoc sp. PCC 7524]|uniref:hypothetical protein n=1 Tax=Nostoc sp. (strain ATCC 29411 / PCC 7524) TaxID=28072 RepID=UPI00029EC850|nr:hypothetical protein [Nostoc sp. PCC 7524]AFY47880.1 hypothetical protein Nos7524_2026 [Nostoc sp. PCC 7524]
MFKLSVEQVLASIAALTPEEKAQLQIQLPNVLATQSPNTQPGQNQVNTVSGTSMGGENNALNFSPIQNRDGNVTLSQSFTQQTSPQKQQALDSLAQLKQAIHESEALDPLIKAGATAQVAQVEAELKTPEPNPGIVGQAIATLKQGLEGVQTLAAPTLAVASLVAKAWGIPTL